MAALFSMLVAVFALDRAAKWLALQRPGLGGRASLVGLFSIQPVRNAHPWTWPGGSPAAWLLAIGLGLAAALLLVQIDPLSGRATQVGLGAALGGALGNLYDRLRHGAVLDFLRLGRLSVFNVADAAIVLGLLAVLGSYAIAAAEA
ncbi:MAG: signal peptidase II [Planctomycetota bacterium]|nr:MAG: signal peptidase II [Planctomycetota bacterium]